MRRSLALLGVLFQIAFRNLFAHRAKTLIVGAVICVGTILVVVGTSFLDSAERSMSQSIIGSAAGHLQIYSADSVDDLAIWGSTGQASDLAPLPDFSKVRAVIAPLENVQAILPMGMKEALLPGGNTIDLVLAKLRAAIRATREGGGSAEAAAEVESLKQHVRQIVSFLQSDATNVNSLSGEQTTDAAELEAINRTMSDTFWSEFDADPYKELEFLENRIAPLIADADLIFVSYIGTNLGRFDTSFDRFRIVDGTPVPPGQRGFLFAKYFYDENCKLKTARRLDRLYEGVTDGKTIAGDEDLQRLVKENATQIRDVILQLDPRRMRLAVERLQDALKTDDNDVSALLTQFLTVTDENIRERHAFFYEHIAPLLDLYRIRIGDMLTIQGSTRSGYMRSVNVRVYGTFEFAGLEQSALAGGLNLMDLMTFRDLYGFVTPDNEAEIEQLKQAAGSRPIARASAEEELFGNADIVTTETSRNITELLAFEGFDADKQQAELARRVYSPEEMEDGVFLNAAIVLKDPSRIETMQRIRAAAESQGLRLKVVSWQQAAGLLGQLVSLLRVVLFAAILIVFAVALVIMSNATVMATLQRVSEIGTLRAIGSQKSFVSRMLLLEALVVGAVFGFLGVALGAAIVWITGIVGIPAASKELYFFFSGPRFFPSISVTNLVMAFVIVLVVTLLSALYPVRLATKVSPLEAMQAVE